jgi:hypothetical protein
VKNIRLIILGVIIQLIGWGGVIFCSIGIIISHYNGETKELFMYGLGTIFFVFTISLGAVVSDKYMEKNKKSNVLQDTIKGTIVFIGGICLG